MFGPMPHTADSMLRPEAPGHSSNEHCPWSLLLPALPRLGTVLLCSRGECLPTPGPASALASARWLRAAVIVERDGPREMLCFGSDRGCTTHLLCLLPDSDFLAWEQLLAALPRQSLMAVPEVDCCRRQERHAFRWVQWLRGALPPEEPRWQVRSGRFRTGTRHSDQAGLDFLESPRLSPSSRRLASLLGDEAASLQLRIDQLAAATGGSPSTH